MTKTDWIEYIKNCKMIDGDCEYALYKDEMHGIIFELDFDGDEILAGYELDEEFEVVTQLF